MPTVTPQCRSYSIDGRRRYRATVARPPYVRSRWLGIIYRRSCGKSGLVGKGRVNGPYVFRFSNAKFESSSREPKSIFNSVSIISRSKICLQHALIRYSTRRQCNFHQRLHFAARMRPKSALQQGLQTTARDADANNIHTFV
jgi:hypothetical protein